MLFKKTLFLLFFLLLLIVLSASSKADVFEHVETNLNMSIADIMMFVVTCAIIIVVAFDVRIALMFALLIYTSLFIVFTLLTEVGFSGFNPYFAGVAMMICFVVICISLLVTYKKSNTPYNVV